MPQMRSQLAPVPPTRDATGGGHRVDLALQHAGRDEASTGAIEGADAVRLVRAGRVADVEDVVGDLHRPDPVPAAAVVHLDLERPRRHHPERLGVAVGVVVRRHDQRLTGLEVTEELLGELNP